MHDSLLEVAEYIKTLQKRQNCLIYSPEEKGFITKEDLLQQASLLKRMITVSICWTRLINARNYRGIC